jgi:hypothetical protein
MRVTWLTHLILFVFINLIIFDVSFGAFTAVMFQVDVFWVGMPCNKLPQHYRASQPRRPRLIILGEAYNLWGFSLCSLLQPPATFSPLHPNTIISQKVKALFKTKHIYCKYTEIKIILLFNVIPFDFNAPVSAFHNILILSGKKFFGCVFNQFCTALIFRANHHRRWNLGASLRTGQVRSG